MKRPWHRSRGWALASWLALALLGLVLAAGISLAASRLSSQHIGLSSEPLNAGEGLAPSAVQAKQRPAQRPKRHHRSKPGSNSQAAPPQSLPPAQVAPAPVQPAPVQPAPVQPLPSTTSPSTRPDHQDDSHHDLQDHHSGGDD